MRDPRKARNGIGARGIARRSALQLPTFILHPGRLLILTLLLPVAALPGGCASESSAKANARAAYLAGQNQELLQEQSEQFPTVTVLGPVQNSKVPWVVGLTLSQAIATANYLAPRAPGKIILTRQGESAELDPNDLLNGAQVPLEAGDVIQLQP